MGRIYQINEKYDIQYDTEAGSSRCGETDSGETGIRLYAHKIGKRQSYKEGLDQSLQHDPQRLFVAIIVAYHAEKYGGHDRFRGKAFEVFKALLYNGFICGKNRC